MAVTLGKRKRRADVQEAIPATEPESDNEDLQTIFRRAFEAKFRPLEGTEKKAEAQEEEDGAGERDTEEELDWSGISEAEEDAVEVVEHTASRSANERADKHEMKAFMVCLC